MTRALMNLAASKALDQSTAADGGTDLSAVDVSALRSACEAAKMQLSATGATNASVAVPLAADNNSTKDATVSVAEFETACKPLMQRCGAVIAQVGEVDKGSCERDMGLTAALCAAAGAGGGVTRCGGCRRGDHCWWSHTNAVCASYAARHLPCNCTQQDAAWVRCVCTAACLLCCVVLCCACRRSCARLWTLMRQWHVGVRCKQRCCVVWTRR